jgi:hypothetical protein
MPTIKYFYEFNGFDGIDNRVEIIDTVGSPVPREIIAGKEAFSIEYPQVKKLEPLQGSGATLLLIDDRKKDDPSYKGFGFTDLYTDQMQQYIVKHYRRESRTAPWEVNWIGWLDSETYNEHLSDTPPYEVEFTASDFNILDRLKYRDGDDARWGGTVSLWEHLKRCLQKLNLPFGSIYVYCSTYARDIFVKGERALEHMFITSGNFYDEDGEPMSLRETIESIFRTFALMMVQRGGDIYIYDYNLKAESGDAVHFLQYDASEFKFIGLREINVKAGNIPDTGFAGTEGEYGYEEPYNNVQIRSSIYADTSGGDFGINDDNLKDFDHEEAYDPIQGDDIKYYNGCGDWEIFNGTQFMRYNIAGWEDSKKIVGGILKRHTGSQDVPVTPRLRMTPANELVLNEDDKLVIAIRVYPWLYNCLSIDGKIHPDDAPTSIDAVIGPPPGRITGVLKDKKKRQHMGLLFGDLVMIDKAGNPVWYYKNYGGDEDEIHGHTPRWISASSGVPPAGFVTGFAGNERLNEWIIQKETGNSPLRIKTSGDNMTVVRPKEEFQGGIEIIHPPENGLQMQLTLYDMIFSKPYYEGWRQDFPWELCVLLTSVEIKAAAKKGELRNEDTIFRSYINKKVKSDYPSLTLKVVGVWREGTLIGRANLLDESYKPLTDVFARGVNSGALPEELLLATIHSNHSVRNQSFGVEINGCENVMGKMITYLPLLEGVFMVTGCKINFSAGKTTLQAVGFSEDTMSLSDIPYD